MARYPGVTGTEHRARINMGEASEVEYWAKTLGVSKDRLAEAVRKVGDSLQAVRRELGAGDPREP